MGAYLLEQRRPMPHSTRVPSCRRRGNEGCTSATLWRIVSLGPYHRYRDSMVVQGMPMAFRNILHGSDTGVLTIQRVVHAATVGRRSHLLALS